MFITDWVADFKRFGDFFATEGTEDTERISGERGARGGSRGSKSPVLLVWISTVAENWGLTRWPSDGRLRSFFCLRLRPVIDDGFGDIRDACVPRRTGPRRRRGPVRRGTGNGLVWFDNPTSTSGLRSESKDRERPWEAFGDSRAGGTANLLAV